MIHHSKRRSSQARSKVASQRRRAQRKRSLLFERLETRHLLAADWQNPLFNLDVNDDAFVSPIDALFVVNSLNSLGARELTEPFDNDSPTAAYLDVNGDGFVAPSDALALINDLNQRPPSLPVSLALANDSGASAADRISNDSRVQGQAVLGGAAVALAKVRVNREAVLPLSLDAEGRFEIDPRLLSSFTEGAAKIRVFVSTASGAQTLSGLRLTLDATPPLSPTVAGFSADSGVLGDGITTDDTLLVTGSSEPGVRVKLFFNGSIAGTATASAGGSWSFAAASRDDGLYAITAVAEDTAGNASLASLPLVVQIATGFLRGSADDPANMHIPDVYFPDVPAGDLSLDDRPDGTGLETSRTRLMVQFMNTATVGQVNSLLESLDASIIGAISEIDLVLISIPDTGDFTGLDSALVILESHPAVALVVQDVALGVTSLPAPTTAQDSAGNPWVWSSPPSDVAGGLDGNWGLEAVRAPQMWSLNDFGFRQVNHPRTGVLDAGFNDMDSDGVNDHPQNDLSNLHSFRRSLYGFSHDSNVSSHGQHVAGIIGAGFDNDVGVDGINPLVERQSSVDDHFIGISARFGSASGNFLSDQLSAMLSLTIADLRSLLATWPDLDVLNISLGYNWGSNSNGLRDPNISISAQRVARDQGMLVRQIAALHPSAIIVAAAGNDSVWGYPNEIDARWASPFAFAGVGGTVITANVVWPNSPNVLVVESVDGLVANSAAPSYAWQYTKSDFSNVGGDVSAPGGSILSTVGNNIILDNDSDGLFDEDPANTPPNDDDSDGLFDEDPVEGNSNYMTFNGTSMAAPHVTGLIGYLLTLEPDLTVAQIRTLLTQPQFTRTTQLRAGDTYPASVVNLTPRPMIDAFSAALGIDLVTGDDGKSIQQALVDVDDGSLDGNLRVDPLTGQAVTEIFTDDERRGDGEITMRDFRAWRDAYLQTIAPYLSAELGVSLDGAADHVKKDLNFNGVVATDDELLHPRYDFNGDGALLDWSAQAPFKIDPDTPPPPSPPGMQPLVDKSTNLQSSPGFLRDIDVLADPVLWSELEADGYSEGVTVFPFAEGTLNLLSPWNETCYLLANRDPSSASDFLKDLPDYIHSFDVHVSIDWTALDYGHDAILLRIDSEMAGLSFGEHFRREAVIPAGTADFVVTIPLWTGKVQVRVAGFDRDDETLPNLDAVSPRENWSGLKFGQDRALKIEARDYKITNLHALLAPFGVDGSSHAVAINNLGDVIVDGRILSTDETRLFLIDRDGVVTDLEPLIPGYYIYGLSMNDSLEIAGTRLGENEGGWGEGFIYRHGQSPSYIDLGVDNTPYDINESGDVVGEMNRLGRGFVRYRDGTTILLGDEANGINNLGDVVGRLDAGGFVYRDSDGDGNRELIDIGTPPVTGTIFMNPSDINDSGQIVGFYRRNASSIPFFWEEGNWTTFPSFGSFQVMDINESGVAVGNEWAQTIFGAPNYSSWRLTISGGSNINNLKPSGSPFGKLMPVDDINDRGDIVGRGELVYPFSGAFVLKKVL
jgi:Subtilase family/Bacterial Ig-like domain/Dockerin type I domain